LLNNQDDAAVRFEFPIASSQFDVTKTTVIMGVSEGGKIVKRPVIVTTIVAQ
jgi:predicted ester cyclase